MGEINMDGGAFRAPQSPDRRVPARPETPSRSVEEPLPLKEQPRTSFRPELPPAAPKKSVFKKLAFPIIIVVLMGLGFATGSFLSEGSSAEAPIDSSKYQAVFSTSGLVYFGKLQSLNADYFKLSKAYYVEQQPSDNGETQVISTDIKLIKRSDAIHNPDNEMIIPKSQVLFYENLKSDSKVAQAMENDTSP